MIGLVGLVLLAVVAVRRTGQGIERAVAIVGTLLVAGALYASYGLL